MGDIVRYIRTPAALEAPAQRVVCADRDGQPVITVGRSEYSPEQAAELARVITAAVEIGTAISP
jgi:hypothetical protein